MMAMKAHFLPFLLTFAATLAGAEVKPPNTVLESSCGKPDALTTLCLAQNITSGQRFVLFSTPEEPRMFLPVLGVRHEPGAAGSDVTLFVYSVTRVRGENEGGRYPIEEALELETWRDPAADGSLSARLKRVGSSAGVEFRLEPMFHTLSSPRGGAR